MLLFLLAFVMPPFLCMVVSLALSFKLSFEFGPILTLIALPVAVGVLVVSSAGNFFDMFDAYIMPWLIGFFVVDLILLLIIGRFGFGRLMLHTCVFAVLLSVALLGWMHLPKPVPDLDGTVRLEVQEIHQEMQAVTLDPAYYEPLVDMMEEVEMKGSFEELVEHDVLGRVYRFTCEDSEGEEVASFYLISNRYMMMKHKDKCIYFEADNGTRFPTDEAIELFEQVVPG